MYLTSGLYREIFEDPYREGYRNLNVLAGYVTPGFVEFLLLELEELKLNIIVGMTSSSGLSINNHLGFLNLTMKYQDRLEVLYQTEKPGLHMKAYVWEDVDNQIIKLPKKIFVGSANMSHNAFFKQGELMVEFDPNGYEKIFDQVATIDCRDALVYENIDVYMEEGNLSKKKLKINEEKIILNEIQKYMQNNNNNYIDISLLSNGEVPSKSSLNWGQRAGRNKDQAYLPVIKSIHDANPDFFPEKKEPFMLTTDDGESILCVMAQDNRKAIHSSENNSILGLYFRKRLGLNSGEFVTKEHLNNYGRNTVRIYKIDKENYYLDFSVK